MTLSLSTMFQRGFGVLESFTLWLYLSVHEPDPEADTKASHKGRNGREIGAVFFLIHSNYAYVKRRGIYTQVHVPGGVKGGALDPLELSCVSLVVSQPM